MKHYSDPNRASDPYALPDLEVFYLTAGEARQWTKDAQGGPDGPNVEYVKGWYYWSCFPGCLPDSDPMGPYDTEDQALAAAREDSGVEDDEDEQPAEDEQDDPEEPDEDSLTTEDHERFYQYGRIVLSRFHLRGLPPSKEWYYHEGKDRIGQVLGVFHDDYKAAVRAYMDRVQFWPDCYFISDHGNAHRIDLSEGKD